MNAHGDEPDSGPKLPDGLGEPQWAAMLSQPRAHFLTLHARGPAWVMTGCGLTLINQMIYHPGTMPLCEICRSRHDPPDRKISPGIVAWFTRPHFPADRFRRV